MSTGRKGPFEPGKLHDTYQLQEYDTNFITVLDYVPFRKNKYSLAILPGKLFLSFWCFSKQKTFKLTGPVRKSSFASTPANGRSTRTCWRVVTRRSWDVLRNSRATSTGARRKWPVLGSYGEKSCTNIARFWIRESQSNSNAEPTTTLLTLLLRKTLDPAHLTHTETDRPLPTYTYTDTAPLFVLKAVVVNLFLVTSFFCQILLL